MAAAETGADKTANIEGFGELKYSDILFMARVAETAERYDDMTKFMFKLVTMTAPEKDLNVEERNLLSVAYKNVVGSRRASWRTLNLDEHKANEHVKIFRAQVEKELATICTEVLDLLSKYLVPAAKDDIEARVFYLKMAGDYYRYFAEFQADAGHPESALKHYKLAFELAKDGDKETQNEPKGLTPTHPIRLGLALNFSVCYYEILKQPEQACKLAKNAFDDAVAKLEELTEHEYKDSTLIMQLLRDNLTLWTQDNQDNSGEE